MSSNTSQCDQCDISFATSNNAEDICEEGEGEWLLMKA